MPIVAKRSSGGPILVKSLMYSYTVIDTVTVFTASVCRMIRHATAVQLQNIPLDLEMISQDMSGFKVCPNTS